jgi:hypothetical protein
MTHQSFATIGQLQMLHTGTRNFGFQLDRARKKLPGSSPKNNRQWIADLTGLTKANNVDNLVHGVSLSLRGSGRLDTRPPHSSNRHHPVSALAHVAAGAVQTWRSIADRR